MNIVENNTFVSRKVAALVKVVVRGAWQLLCPGRGQTWNFPSALIVSPCLPYGGQTEQFYPSIPGVSTRPEALPAAMDQAGSWTRELYQSLPGFFIEPRGFAWAFTRSSYVRLVSIWLIYSSGYNIAHCRQIGETWSIPLFGRASCFGLMDPGHPGHFTTTCLQLCTYVIQLKPPSVKRPRLHAQKQVVR